jgi:hypothetical protein
MLFCANMGQLVDFPFTQRNFYPAYLYDLLPCHTESVQRNVRVQLKCDGTR